MKSRIAAAIALTTLIASGAAGASDYALVMPTGAVVNCSDVGKIRFKDMSRLYGMNNFSKEYQQYVRFHTYAPKDCQRAESREALVAKGRQPWQMVAKNESAPR